MPRPSRFSKGGDFDAARESRFWTGAQPITRISTLERGPSSSAWAGIFCGWAHAHCRKDSSSLSLSAPKLMRFVKALQSPRHGRGYVRNRAEVSDWMNIPAQAKLELIG